MELLDYLNTHFYRRNQVLDQAKVDEAKFRELQDKGLMPACSYSLKIDLKGRSFFGESSEVETQEYYAKGNLAWLGVIQGVKDASEAFAIFSQRYKQTITTLANAGLHSDNPKLNSEFDAHLKEEWGYFLDGTYGLCTQSGLPEDIASKELGMLLISEITAQASIDEQQLQTLTQAVNLLDQASSLFAPHERSNSSRFRFVDEVRRKYQLKNSGT